MFPESVIESRKCRSGIPSPPFGVASPSSNFIPLGYVTNLLVLRSTRGPAARSDEHQRPSRIDPPRRFARRAVEIAQAVHARPVEDTARRCDIVLTDGILR